MSKSKRIKLNKKQSINGWIFLAPATLMIVMLSFVPMVRALILSFQKGTGAKLSWTGVNNYVRMFSDNVFMQSLLNNFIYLLIQVPIMLILALILAAMLNNKSLKFKGLFRTAIFLPCATSLVSYAIVFRTLFSNNGLVNYFLIKLGILETGYSFLTHTTSARIIIIIALIWRWTGYNMLIRI